MGSTRWLAHLAGLSLALAACNTAEDQAALSAGQLEPARLPEGLAQGFNEMLPGGDTTCAVGDPYAFWVRPGTVNKVIIDFIGGGACWNAFTCGINAESDAICSQDVDNVRDAVAAGEAFGIYDQENPENPFAGWYHVIVPYCTCDVHWGDNLATYTSTAGDITVHHKGAVNTRAVLDWVYENFSAPEQIFVTGCSAGSYGSIGWTPHIAEHYPGSRVVQFGDSGAGIITQDFFEQSFPSWNAEPVLPSWVEGLDLSEIDLLDLTLGDLYVRIANHYAEHQLSQYNTAFDENQTFFFEAMGGVGGAEEWSKRMRASIADIEARAPTFTSFIAPGELHCIIRFDNFYTVHIGDRRLVDWLAEMVAGERVEHVACSGSACEAETP